MRNESNRNPKHMRKVRIDYAMGAALLVLAARDLLPSLVHGAAVGALLVLLAIHLWQHRTWFKALGRGKWNQKRLVKTACIGTATVALIACAALGFSISPEASAAAAAGSLVENALPHHVLGYVTVAACALHALTCARRQHARSDRGAFGRSGAHRSRPTAHRGAPQGRRNHLHSRPSA